MCSGDLPLLLRLLGEFHGCLVIRQKFQKEDSHSGSAGSSEDFSDKLIPSKNGHFPFCWGSSYLPGAQRWVVSPELSWKLLFARKQD